MQTPDHEKMQIMQTALHAIYTQYHACIDEMMQNYHPGEQNYKDFVLFLFHSEMMPVLDTHFFPFYFDEVPNDHN